MQWNCGALFVGGRFQSIHQLFFIQLVINADVPYTSSSQQFVPLLHFFHGPGKDRFSFSHVRDDGMHQVRQGFVTAQLDHLWIDHQHANLVGAACHQDRRDNCVQADTFSRSRTAGNQQVWERGQVDGERASRNIFTQEERNPHFSQFSVRIFHYFSKPDQMPLFIGHLDSHGILSRDGGHHADTGNP